MNKIELLFVLTMLIVPGIVLIYHTLHSQIPSEPDAYYWISFSEYSNVGIANFSIFLMWISIFMLFTFVKNPQRSPYFIASLFLLNLLSMRFLFIELKDFLFYFVSLGILIWVKNNDFKIRNFKIDAKLIGILMLIMYVGLHNFTLNIFGDTSNIHTESRPSITAFLNIFPVLYILNWRKERKWMLVIIVLTVLFMTEKATATGMTPLIFAIYMDFLTAKEFSIKGTFSWFFLIFFVLNLIGFTITHVKANEDAFNRLCDPNTHICTAKEVKDYSYGHYFAWLGYRTHNPVEFAQCKCIGEGCFEPYKIVCGTGQPV